MYMYMCTPTSNTHMDYTLGYQWIRRIHLRWFPVSTGNLGYNPFVVQATAVLRHHWHSYVHNHAFWPVIVWQLLYCREFYSMYVGCKDMECDCQEVSSKGYENVLSTSLSTWLAQPIHFQCFVKCRVAAKAKIKLTRSVLQARTL